MVKIEFAFIPFIVGTVIMILGMITNNILFILGLPVGAGLTVGIFIYGIDKELRECKT